MREDTFPFEVGERQVANPSVIGPAKHTIASIRGIVPALSDREAGDFEAQIDEAIEEAAEPEGRERTRGDRSG